MSSQRTSAAKSSPIYPVIMPVPLAMQQLAGREKVKALSQQARKALFFSCKKSGWPILHLKKDPNGVPIPENGYYWSLSHKSRFVAAVVAPYPIGIDIERLQPSSKALRNRIASTKEWQLEPEIDPDLLFFRFWTAKEAVLKAVGVGMSGLSNCRIIKILGDSKMRLTYQYTTFMVSQIQFNGHLATVIIDNRPICWTHLLK
jgi:4'-phosphopantetheinyl transferase